MLTMYEEQLENIFSEALSLTFGFEGGEVNDAADSGGHTNFGVTEMLARDYGFAGDMSFLTKDKAKDIFRWKFWLGKDAAGNAKMSPAFAIASGLLHVDAGRVERALPLGILAFDFSVNSGNVGFVKALQNLLNVSNANEKLFDDLADDGLWGKKTEMALLTLLDKRGCRHVRKLLLFWRSAFFFQLAQKRKKDERFLAGWINRVIEIDDYFDREGM